MQIEVLTTIVYITWLRIHTVPKKTNKTNTLIQKSEEVKTIFVRVENWFNFIKLEGKGKKFNRIPQPSEARFHD